MRIVVVGAGGVGGLFGALLARSGEQVTFLARGATLEKLRADGIRIEGVSGDFSLDQVHAESSADEIGNVDLVLVAVKAWQIDAIAPSLLPLVGPGTYVIPLQNGVEASRQLGSVLGDQYVLGGTCKVISKVVARGQICHVGVGPVVTFGPRGHSMPEDAHESIRDSFAAAGITADFSNHIDVAIWEKFIFINAMSGLGAVTRATLGEIRSMPETRALLKDVMREAFQVGRASGVDLTDDVVSRTMDFYDSLPSEGTSSMQRDIMDSRPSELEQLNGAVVRLGRESNIPTPVNQLIYSCLLPQEAAARQTPIGS